jgi:diguanylate cyclase (GGDEF)-like protein
MMSDRITNILIVDDQPRNLTPLINLLHHKGYTVRTSITGDVALKTTQIEPPDLILLDVCMPTMNGYEVCSALKANPETSNIPVIFLSALNHSAEKAQAFAVGGADYITKPFYVDEVFTRINYQLTIQRQQQQLVQYNQILLAMVMQQQRLQQQLQVANQELEQLAYQDGLTQVANRRTFNQVLHLEWNKLRRIRQPLSLILCDVDYFKLFNDRYGHLVGDRCLQLVAQAIAASAKRPGDLVARYGGEEFVVLLPNVEAMGALIVAERIRKAIAELNIPHQDSPCSSSVTISCGISTLFPMLDSSPDQLITSTDEALYCAKKSGRNNCFVR